jgi:MFS transporter, UMF1 family
VVGIIADYTGEIRYGFLFLLFLLAVPIPILLWCVDVEKGREDAALYAMESSRHEEERIG